jgi:hypothetical protein
MRVNPQEFLSLPFEAHSILHDVPLHDVSAVDLPGGGEGRTVGDVQSVIAQERLTGANPVVSALFGLRRILGASLGWDADPEATRPASYIQRLPEELRARSSVVPGTPEGMFITVYRLDREALAEIRNATAHAFLCTALQPRDDGYRLYWAVYVKPVSWFTPIYMTVIEPFRRFIVYPAILRRIRRAWVAAYKSA